MERPPIRYAQDEMALARSLGIVSIAIGLLDTLGRRRVVRGTGIDNPRLFSLYGAREMLTGIGLMLARDPMPWVWGRVAGDALDLGTLATGVREGNPRARGAGLGLAFVAGITALDLALAWRLHATAERSARAAG